MLDAIELNRLEDRLHPLFNNSLQQILSFLNRTGQLDEFLELIHMDIPEPVSYQNRKGKILVLGQNMIKEKDLNKAIKALHLDENRFELCLDYDRATHYNIEKLRYNSHYCLILAGPMGHSGLGKGDYSSKLTAMETQSGYPPVIRLGNGHLKITKTDIINKLKEAIDKGIISA